MTDLRQAAQQALEALENTSPLGFNMESDKKFYAAITALKAALEQPEQEPVAWIFTPNTDLLWPAEVEAKNPIELNSYQPLYTTPPAAKCPWQGLTDEDVNRESAPITSQMKLAFHAGMYVAQQVLKERNT
jgi:hypothetical protein